MKPRGRVGKGKQGESVPQPRLNTKSANFPTLKTSLVTRFGNITHVANVWLMIHITNIQIQSHDRHRPNLGRRGRLNSALEIYRWSSMLAT